MITRQVAAALALAASLTACSSTESAEQAEQPATSLPERVRTELLSVREAENGISVTEFNAMIAEETAACMREQGFDYIAVTDLGGSVSVGLDGLTPEQYLDQFGFGMLTRIEIEAFQAPPTNPNDAAYEMLTPGEREAFDETLSRCAVDAHDSVGPAPNQALLSEQTLDVIDDISRRALSTDAYLDAEAAWQNCMRESGYEFLNRQDMFAQLGQNAERFAEPYLNALNALYGTQDFDAAASLRMKDALGEKDYDAYVAAVRFEIEIAQADSICGAGLDEAYDEFYQAEFDALLDS